MSKFLKAFRKDESGAAMVEYAIALLVAAAIGTATFTQMGTSAATNATNACNVISNSNANC